MVTLKFVFVFLLIISIGCNSDKKEDVVKETSYFYTHALWKVKPGHEKEFIEAWMELSDLFSNLPNPPIRGTLIQSTTDSTLFYSFGPWRSLEDITAMRNDQPSQEGIKKIMSLCTEATPATYRVIKHIQL